MTQIENANGTTMGVTVDARFMSEIVTRDYALACTQAGYGFTFYDAAVTPTGAADVFGKLQNDSAMQMVVTRVTIYDAGAELVHLQLSAAYSSGGTHGDVEPVNRLRGSALLASTYGTFESDVDITGDSGATIRTLQIAATTEQTYDLSDSPIVLGTNQALILEAATGTSAIRWEADFYFAAVATQND